MRNTAQKNRVCRVKSQRMKIFSAILAVCLAYTAATTPVIAAGDESYVKKTGERVTVFESAANNYRLELGDEAYTYVDFSQQVPDASFAAIRFRPNAFSLVVVEKPGVAPDAEQYADMVQLAMADQLAARGDAEFKGTRNLGFVKENGLDFFQKAIYAEIAGMPVTYVLSALVDGERAYQLLTFATNETEDTLRAEAAKLRKSFSIPDRSANMDIKADPRSVRDYRSDVFGYRFRARGNGWFDWSDLKASNDSADIGALSSRGYGAVVMPVCWQGARPADVAIYRIMMQQFGEDYPSDFITEEHTIEKMGATGKLLIGTEESEGKNFLYHYWIVANDHCAYALAAWGPEQESRTRTDLVRLWTDFEIFDRSTAGNLQYNSDAERLVNASLLNALGLHFYEAKSFRDAYRFFANASDLAPRDEAFLTNTLRSLVEVDAYHEARDWLQPRLGPFGENQNVRSWDAWLAYQTDDRDKAIRIYRELFAAGYREDDDFSTFASMLADAELWDELDRSYSAYTAGGVNDKTRLVQVQLLSRRERYEDALSLLDEMTTGRPLNADLVFERMSILDNMGRSAEVLELAESLIQNGYRSLRTYYYKGDAEYQLRSYRAAKESFEQALKFAPGNTKLREYLDAIDQMLGQGDVSTISAAIEAVPLPKAMQKVFAANDIASSDAGYGAEFLSRISGYDYAGGETLRETQYRKIRVVDDNGISQFSTLEFDFDPSYEQLFVNSLVVRNAAGEVLGEGDINSYYITNDEDGYEASTEKTAHLPVPSLAPGVIIEAIVSKQTSVEPGTFPLETVYLASERPIAYSALFVTGKLDDIRYKSNGVSKPLTRGSAIVWELQSPLPFRWEPLQPYYDQILPWVQLGTVGTDWRSVGAEYLEKIKDKLDTGPVKDRAQRLVDGVDSVERKIEILSAYVQDEIHYKAIEFGRRAYIPKTARETMRDRYGDCKDHAVLLYAMMEAVGIDASLALVNLQQSVVPELPNTDQFNHVIVAVPTASGRLFIDTTDKDMRLGQLPPRSLAGNRALLLDDTPELVEIPKYETGLTGLSIDRVVEPAGDEHIQVRETARFSGYQAAEMRGQLRSIETSEMQSSLQRWIASRYPDAELTDYFVENVFDASYDLIVEIKYTLPLETDGTFDVPGFLEAYYLEFDRIADRRFPFEFHYPLRVSATTSLKFPSGHKLDAVTKKPGTGESRFGNWRREVSEIDGNWKIQFDYVASESRFGPEDYRDFADFQRKTVAAIEQALALR
jgi:tetratricopeptide (TPR) repeat protein/transglutaminase-like putative cysteine protease